MLWSSKNTTMTKISLFFNYKKKESFKKKLKKFVQVFICIDNFKTKNSQFTFMLNEIGY